MNRSMSPTDAHANALALAHRLEHLLDELARDNDVDRYDVRVARGLAGTLSDHLRALAKRGTHLAT